MSKMKNFSWSKIEIFFSIFKMTKKLRLDEILEIFFLKFWKKKLKMNNWQVRSALLVFNRLRRRSRHSWGWRRWRRLRGSWRRRRRWRRSLVIFDLIQTQVLITHWKLTSLWQESEKKKNSLFYWGSKPKTRCWKGKLELNKYLFQKKRHVSIGPRGSKVMKTWKLEKCFLPF